MVFSILMPIYNGIEFIDESVMSVVNQTYGEWELLIGINGHPANSNEYIIAKQYEAISSKIKVFDFHHLHGKSVTLNAMLEFTSYNNIAILDVDDIWHTNKLLIQSAYINEYDVVGTQCVYFGDKNNIYPSIPLKDISSFDFIKVNPIINSSSVTKKHLCYWDDAVDGVEDYDLWLRLRMKGCTFYNCPEVLVKHRIHAQSAFNSNGKNNKLVPKLLQKYRKG